MTQNFICNLRRIFEQILEDYRKFDNQGLINQYLSVENLLNLARQQLLLGQPRVILTPIDAKYFVDSTKMHSPQNILRKFLEREESEIITSNTTDDSDVQNNLIIIQKMIDATDHAIPFIDFTPSCQGNREISDEEDNRVNTDDLEENKKSNSEQEAPVSKSIVQQEFALADLAVDAEILEMMESLIRDENNKIARSQLEVIDNNNVQTVTQEISESPTTVRRGRRIRKPVPSYDYNVLKFPSSPEPVPKKKKKSRPTQAAKLGVVQLNNNVVKVTSRPVDSVERPEVEILFPASLQDRNLKISLDLNKLDLPANVYSNISQCQNANITKTTSNNRSKKKSKPKAKLATQEKSDLAKYLEYFSTNCEASTQNINYAITSTNSESPHNTITTTTVDNLQDQISTTQIESTVSTFLTSNERGEWILTTEPVPCGQIVTTSTSENLQRPQQQATTARNTTTVTSTDNTTQVDEDFIIPMDIENNAFRLVEFIENDNETFSNQQSTAVHQSTQSEFPVVHNSENTKNSKQPVVKITSLQNRSVSSCKRERSLSNSGLSAPGCIEHNMFSKFDDNRVRAHASSCLYRTYGPTLDVLDLSMHKTETEIQDQINDVIDLCVRSESSLEIVVQNQEVLLDCSLSGSNDARKNDSSNIDRDANKIQEILKDRSVRKISFEEYKNRQKDIPDNAIGTSVSNCDNDSNQKKGETNKRTLSDSPSCEKPKVSIQSAQEKLFPICKDMPNLGDDMDLDYEFDNSFKEPCITPVPEKTRPTSDLQADSPVTKDSGICSADFGNGNPKTETSNSNKGNTSTFYADKGLESLLSDNDVDEDDALSIYAHSLLGSPLNISDTNDDNFRDICTPEFDQEIPFITSSPTKQEPRSSTEKPKFDPIPFPSVSHSPALSSNMTTYLSMPSRRGPDELLKNFKIPKIKPQAIAPHCSNEATATTSIPQGGTDTMNALNRFNFMANNSTQQVKRTKSISPPNRSPSSRSSISVSSLPPDSDLHSRKVVVCHIFGSPCFGFLAEGCKKARCNYSHRYIDAAVLKSRLSHLSAHMLQNAYKFIWRNYKLFNLYFPTFCQIYGERGDKARLIAMVRDCEMYSDSLRFLKNIVSSLIKTGLPNTNSVQVVIDNVRAKSNEVIDILIEIILEYDPVQFLEVLEMYSTHPVYRFKMDSINKMANICNQTKHFDLIQILLKIIIFQVSQDDLMNYRSEDIMKFLVMVRSYHPAEKVQNVCANYITNAQTGENFFQNAPVPTRTNTKSVLPSLTIPPNLGFQL